jgi:tRNA(Ile2)-agmatinylcytidine synthase
VLSTTVIPRQPGRAYTRLFITGLSFAPPVLLAFDNTDGPAGGCTTHAAFRVLLALPELALRGLPRLVRLNPNVPWKTRGNAAVVLPLGLPEGPQVRAGELRGREILAFPEGRPAAVSADVVGRVWSVLQDLSQPGALPGVAAFAEPPPAAAYWQAVRTFVEPREAKEALDALAAPHQAAGDGRALVGCLAAAAWPGPPSSFELIAYREPQAWGKPRQVDPKPLLGLDATGATFHTFDAEALRPCCIPHSPDPVLLGLRGRDPQRLHDAAVPAIAAAAREPVDGWLLWASNQASGDHVSPVGSLAEAPPMSTPAVEATVTAVAVTRPGSHVALPLVDAAGTPFEAMAFEPTKGFRDRVRALAPGDRVRAVGAWAEGSVRLEKLEVLSLAPRLREQNPTCRCGRHMRSKGPSTGFKCPSCGAFLGREAMRRIEEPAGIALGWHEVPVIARRHLHRPAAWPSPAGG